MKILGIDIGHHAVKAVSIQSGLLKKAILEVRHVPVQQEDRAAAVREACAGGSYDLVAASLDRASVVTRNLVLPFQDPAQIKKVVAFEAEGHLPFSAEQGYIDHYVVEPHPDGGTEVLVLAISREDFEAHRDLFEALPRQDAFYQVDAYANLNALLEVGALPGEGTVALIDCGATKCSVDILREGKLAFSRIIVGGGARITEDLAEVLSVSLDEAERIKIEALNGADPPPEDIQKVVDRHVGKLLSELRFTFLSYRNAGGGAPPEQAIMTGGMANLAPLRQALSEQLGLEVLSLAERAAGAVGTPLQDSLEVAAGAYGMALYGRDSISLLGRFEGEVMLDFLKEDRSFLKYHRKKVFTAAALAAALLALYVGSLFYTRATLSDELASLDSRIEETLAEVNRLQEAGGRNTIERDGIQAAAGDVDRLLAQVEEGNMSKLGILDEISRLIPANLEFIVHQFELSSGLVTIRAQTDRYQTADQIQKALEQSQIFQKPTIDEQRTIQVGQHRKLDFRLRFRVGDSSD